MMNTCHEIHPSIAYSLDECPLCVALQELGSGSESFEKIVKRFDELEKDTLERLEFELSEELKLLRQAKEIKCKTDMLVGCFEAPFAGEYKNPEERKESHVITK